MDKLWAPWRMRYIKKIYTRRKCIFCEALKSKNPKKHFLLLKTPHSMALLNIFPYNNGHLMVAPKKHTGDLGKLSPKELVDVMNTVSKMIILLKRILKPDGFNIGMNIGKSAGAGITSHLHIHIVPRWIGDTNFITVCSDTKIISQGLEELYSQIKKCLRTKK